MRLSAWLAIPLLLAAFGCGSDDPAPGCPEAIETCPHPDRPDAGPPPVEVVDLRYAREMVASGLVPPPEALLVEAMLAEHDLSLAGEPCAGALCLRAAIGVAPDGVGATRGWLQLGLITPIDRQAWVRPANVFIFVADHTSSRARELMHRLTDQLTAADQVAIVVQGRAPRQTTSGAAHPEVHAAIDELAMAPPPGDESNLPVAIEFADEVRSQGRKVRVLHFTAHMLTSADADLELMIDQAAQRGVELTSLVVVGNVLPDELAQVRLSRGRNAFQVRDVEAFMAAEYPHFTSAIAYDVEIEVTPSVELAADQQRGLPTFFWSEHRISLPSVFFDDLDTLHRGIKLTATAAATPPGLDELSVALTFSYATAGGQNQTSPATLARAGVPLDARGAWFTQPTLDRAVALSVLATRMGSAAARYPFDHAAAVTLMTEADARFRADAAAIGDPSLDPVLALSAAILELMIAGAPQGVLPTQD